MSVPSESGGRNTTPDVLHRVMESDDDDFNLEDDVSPTENNQLKKKRKVTQDHNGTVTIVGSLSGSAMEKKERNVNVYRKSKQSLDANRSNDAKMEVCSGRRCMYKPYPRPPCPYPVPWSRLQSHMSSNYNVHQKQKQSNPRVLRPFNDVFGPKTKRKCPCLLACDYQSLAEKGDAAQDDFEEKCGASGTAEANEADAFRDLEDKAQRESNYTRAVLGKDTPVQSKKRRSSTARGRSLKIMNT
ncbi:nuclear/nucleolar GTPase 2-like isoform X2 [Lotus japonicus]|uniref:nuclear/nucleolar GTPase 2-like isoform X2 n=1 Tax=Lotus japonicus TaxID=34305 RepID=UPI00258FE487|nr:nuclear/nucleolar GTPase 2-like isoform X2 [Lotus japonicus]